MKLICSVLGALLIWATDVSAQTLRIYYIDVEQADAALVITPNGKTLLIDSGKNGHGKRIKAVMDTAGVTQIDAFVVSHYHQDHLGGIDDLAKLNVSVLDSFDRGQKDKFSAAAKKAKTLKGYLETVGEDAHALRPGDTINLDPLVTITCIAASGSVLGDPSPPPPSVNPDEENDRSVSLLVTFAGFKAFFGGDSEGPTEAKIAAVDLVTDVDLYKANHHASHTSSSKAFMAALRPSAVVISNGNHKTFRHPRDVTLQTYAGLAGPPTVLQTNKCRHALPCQNVPGRVYCRS